MKEEILIKGTNISKKEYNEEEEEEEIFDYIYDRSKMKKISLKKLLFSQSSKLEIIYLFLGIIGGIFNGITAQLLEYYTGKLITYFSSDISEDLMIRKLEEILNSYIVVSILSFIFGFLLMSFCSLYQKKISKKYRQKYFEMLLAMDMEWFDKSGKTIFEINNQVTLELNAIDKGIGNSIGLIFTQLSILIFGYCFSLYICWQFTLILLILLPFTILIQLIIGTFSQKNSIKQEKLLEDIGGYLEEKLYKIKTVASFVNYDYEINNFNNKLENYLKYSNYKSFINGLLQCNQTFIIGILFSLSIISGGYCIYKQIKVRNVSITSGDIYAILEIIMGSNIEIQNISQHIKLVAKALEASKTFFNLKEYYEKKSKNKKKRIAFNFNLNEIKGKIKFKNVNFSYPKRENIKILNNFNLVLKSKETTAIIGESGCGKSTIVNLIERIYNCQNGEIILDDKYNINELYINQYRELIGYVSQEPILFNDTIKNNILLGRTATNNEIIEAVKSTNILDFIKGLPNKFEYLTGVQGKKLSGGQKQRIAISRAILLKPKILIFDEATSALDKKNENIFKNIIDSLKGKCTIIIISHKLNLIKNANKIVLLGKEGQILEIGSHNELMESKGKYFEIYINKIENIKDNNDQKEINFEEEETDDNLEGHNNKEILFKDDSKNLEENSIIELKEKKNSDFTKFIEIIKIYKKLLIIGVLFSFLSGISLVILGLILGISIDKITNQNLNIVRNEGIKYSIIMLIYSLISTLIDLIRFYSIGLLGDKLSTNFKSKIFKMFLSMHIGYFDLKKNSPGKLVSEMNLKTSSINDAVLSLLSSLIQCIGNFLAATIIGFLYSWKMTLINSLFIIIIFIINYSHSSYLSHLEKESLNNNFSNIISQTLINLPTVFSFNCQNHMLKIFEHEISKETHNLYIKSFFSGFLQGLVNCIVYLDYGICFYYTGFDVIKNKLSLKNFLECYASIMTATFYIWQTVNNIKSISLMKQSIKELINLLKTKSKINPFDNSKYLVKLDKSTFKGKIEFKNVDFSYPIKNKKTILKNINIVIQPGEKICFTGESGSGKSTICQILERFYDIEEGEILIDDINIKQYNLISLRKNISYVSQEPVLFNDEIINNIKYGNSELKFEEIKKYAEIFKIEDKLKEYNFDNLSGGQKQRIAIMRAILKKSKILILDEATSSLDNQIELEVRKFIFDYINENKITTIVFSHKLNSLNEFNKVYKIVEGNIIELKNSV